MVVRRVLRWFFRLALGLAFLALALILVASYAPDVIRKATADLGKVANIGSKMLAPPLLAERPIIKCAWLKQNWSDEDRAWVHNASQGTATFPVPYAWFRHLERPEITLRGLFAGIDLVSDPAYLARLGFIAPNKDCDPPAPADAPDGYGVLPVGFAVLKGGVDPATGKTFEPALGLTCSACHTGQINYKGVQLRIDGAPAMIDLANLERVIGLSVCYAKLMPWRSGRLADAVLDELPDVTGEAREQKKEAIEKELEDICSKEIFGKVDAERTILARRKLTHTEEGFGRLDALNRIGNQVFHENLADESNLAIPAVGEKDGGLSQSAFEGNFAAHTAPVSFPPIWDVPHFSWAQYDASILNPDIRNIGEAMGVAAKINMTDPNDPARPLFSSTVEVKEIARIETLLRGKEHPLDGEIGFKGLHAPRWEDAATHFSDDDGWKIADEATLQKGRELYFELCFECHRAPFRDPEIAADHPDSFWQEINTDQIDNLPEDRNWITIAGERLLNVVQKPVAEMGTDPEQARVLTERRVTLPSYLGIDAQRDVLEDCGMKGDATLKRSFVVGLMAAVRKVEDQWFLHQGKALSPAEIAAIKSKLPNCPNPRVFVPMVPEPGSHADNAAGGEPKVSYLAKPHYRARPLDGIWATAPYLHNGSVPTLEDLLTPAADRPPTFCVGPVEFDPVKVGLTTQRPVDLPPLPAEEPECEPGLTKFDVTERGNSNRGHSFEGKKGEPLRLGVIGRGLKPNERASLIAYLKTL